MATQERHRGFTLIELLIVVAIIGIIAAIAIPNLLNAIQRGRQKRTMGDIRSIGTAIETYQVDNGVPPNRPGSDLDLIATVGGDIAPTFIKRIPAGDGWNQALKWSDGNDEYSISSWGKDRKKDTTLLTGPTTNFNNDMYYSGGQFTAWPEGTNTN